MRKRIVLSGINLSEGGPLTIYKECLGCLEKYFLKEYYLTEIAPTLFVYEFLK